MATSIIIRFIRPRYLELAKYGQVLGNQVGRETTGASRLITDIPNQQLSEESEANHAKLNKIVDSYINNVFESPHNFADSNLDRFEYQL